MSKRDHSVHAKRFDPSRVERLHAPERQERMPPAAIRSAARLQPGMRVADIGAGSGYCTEALLDSPEAPGRIDALDVSAEMLAALEKRLAIHPQRRRVVTHLGAAEDLPLASSSIDLVVMGNIFHELEDKQKALSEVKRVLVPGGRVLIVDWERPADGSGDAEYGPPFDQRVPETEVREALTKAGFARVEAHPGFKEVYAISAAKP